MLCVIVDAFILRQAAYVQIGDGAAVIRCAKLQRKLVALVYVYRLSIGKFFSVEV